MTQRPYLNLGCGRVILPAAKPAHYGLIDDIESYALWHNVDRNAEPGVDEVLDIFRYPWQFEDNSFDGALCAHICEHIPHEIRMNNGGIPAAEIENDGHGFVIKNHREIELNRRLYERSRELASLQDGWYAFFAELHRVLTPGSIIHVLSPYAWSQGGVTDPTHTRLLTEQSFTHSMQPDPNSPFAYATDGLNLELVDPARYTVTQLFAHLLPAPDDAPDVAAAKQTQLQRAMQTQVNVVYELYVKLRVIK